MADKHCASLEMDICIESLPLAELREWCTLSNREVQKAIARNIAVRMDKMFWELLDLDYHCDNDQTWSISFRFSIMRLRNIIRQALAVIETNQERQITVMKKNLLSVSILMILNVAMVILRDPLCYLNNVEQLSRNIDLFEMRLNEAIRLVIPNSIFFT
ncbi:hypothetical protein TTRE_0000349601 [Trichuris trichiura]|uniref:Uncharacterized protein n=1 Tax=Trichuris trichiura TaxID=36087 RepID=A0A077Z5Z8_TRITR|nr:hypothetical protein TTRE_0000349601 [Trichuris trichiura]